MSETNGSEKNGKMQAKDICLTGMFTALIVVCSQLSIPMPAGVPMTLQTFIIPLAGIVLGAKRGTIATCIYLLLGAVGLPVFAGFSGGIGILFGITGGFLLSFPLLALFAGLGSRHDDKVRTAAGLIIGAVLNYIVGMIMFAALTDTGMGYAFTACVLPFIPTAIIKIVLAEIIGLQMKKLLRRAGVLSVPVNAARTS